MLAAAEVAGWWVLLFGLWLVTLPSVSRAEEVAAAVCALAAAGGAAAGRRVAGSDWKPRPGWIRWLGRTLVAIPVDTARVLRVAVLPGTRAPLTVTRLAVPHEPDGVGEARAALGGILVSATPATVVVDWGEDVVVHRLASGAPSLEETVTT